MLVSAMQQSMIDYTYTPSVCIYLFIFGCAVPLLLHLGFLWLWCLGFSLPLLIFLQTMGSRASGFSIFSAWAWLWWCTGLVAPWHVESSWTRDRTHVPCIGRWLLNHRTTRDVSNMHQSFRKEHGIDLYYRLSKY